MAKNQSELEGFERKTIPKLDTHCKNIIDLSERIRALQNELNGERTEGESLFVVAREKGDISGEIYRYGDGEKTYDFKMNAPTSKLTYKRVESEE